MLTGTSVPYDPEAEHLAQCQDHERVNAVNGTATTTGVVASVSSAPSTSSSSSAMLKNVPIKAIVFSDQSLQSIDNDMTTSHLRPATPSSLRPDASLLERRGSSAEEEEDCSLPSPPPPPSIQTVPVMQLQALHLHQPVPQYPQDSMHSLDMVAHHNPSISSARSCFSPPPPAIVTTALMSSSGTHVLSCGPSSSRQLPPYPPAVPLPKPTPIWITPVQHSSSTGVGGALARERSVTSVSANAYSTASTIAVATGSNSPAVVSTVPILRTFGASAGSRQNSFGS